MKMLAMMMMAAVVVSGALGCGANEVKEFEGTWSCDNATLILNCPGHAPITQTAKGDDTIVEGTDSDVVLTSSEGCNLKFNVANGTATIVPGQTCTSTQQTSDGNTLQLTESFNNYTMTLGKDAKSYTMQATGTVLISEGTQSVTCTVTGSEAATKIGK